MEGMNQQCPHSRILRYDQRPVDGVLQQCAPELDPLRAMINRQSRQHHDRYRLRHVSPHASRGHLVRNRAGRHRVVAVNTAILICDDERAAGTSSLVGYRPAPQPIIQHVLAAGKFIKAMSRGQRLRSSKRKAHSLKVVTGHGAAIDTTTAAGKLVFGIFAALAEFERELIAERTLAGLASARARGRKGGRPFKMTAAKLRLAMAAMGQPETKVGDLCQELGVTRQTLYRHVSPKGELRPDGVKLLARA